MEQPDVHSFRSAIPSRTQTARGFRPSDTPVSLRELAARLGYATVQCLTRRNPETCAEVRKKYNAAKVRTPMKPLARAPANEEIRLALAKALEVSRAFL